MDADMQGSGIPRIQAADPAPQNECAWRLTAGLRRPYRPGARDGGGGHGEDPREQRGNDGHSERLPHGGHLA
jgi:hypothetical protein